MEGYEFKVQVKSVMVERVAYHKNCFVCNVLFQGNILINKSD
jgi:hypothetical protein